MSDIDHHQPATSTDAEHITRVVTRLREVYPDATRFGVTSSDQGNYGYLLCYVWTPAGEFDIDQELETELMDELLDLNWGCFGDRSSDSTFEVDMTTNRIVQ